MAEEAAVVEEDMSPAQSPLVTLSFQRNSNRKQKYLEAEPKALGITQIGLSLFNITCASVFMAKNVCSWSPQIPIFISSLLVIIAGSVALAAQNLHLPTVSYLNGEEIDNLLRACLGMQIVACVASIVNMICTLVNIPATLSICWIYYYHRESLHYIKTCKQFTNAQVHFYSESAVIQAVLFAISVTLAAYCCKVVNCCTPAPKMPVITIQAPKSNNEEEVGYVTSA